MLLLGDFVPLIFLVLFMDSQCLGPRSLIIRDFLHGGLRAIILGGERFVGSLVLLSLLVFCPDPVQGFLFPGYIQGHCPAPDIVPPPFIS